jgi:nucleoside-diphosphate-sugar epimerase
MRVVVTGASGRVGRAIHARLVADGHAVLGFDRSPSSTAERIADLGDVAALRAALAGADAVVHSAALHAPHVGVLPDAEFRRINVDGTRALLDAAAAGGVRRIVLTSTTALYGTAAEGVDAAAWIDEDTVPQPQTIYHHTKLAAESLLREAALQGGPVLRVLRMSRCFPEPAPAMAVLRLQRGVDARDVAQAHALALAHDGPAAATFVVSGATPFRREDAVLLARDAAAAIRLRAPALAEAFAVRGWPLPAAIDRVYDSGRAIATLGWRPRHGFEAVLAAWDAGSSEVLPPAFAAIAAE